MKKLLGGMIVLAGLFFVSVNGISATETAEAPLQQISVQNLSQRTTALKAKNKTSVAALIKTQNQCRPAVYTLTANKPMTAQKVGLSCCTSHGALNAIYCTFILHGYTCANTSGCYWSCR